MNLHIDEGIWHGWYVSCIDGTNWVFSVTEEILSSLPFWEEMEETLKFDKY